jgi:hypothetical protein
MDDYNEMIDEAAEQVATFLRRSARLFLVDGLNYGEEGIQKFINEKVTNLLKALRTVRDSGSLVVLAVLTKDNYRDLPKDIKDLEEACSMQGIAKIQGSPEGGCAIIIVKPEAADIFRTSLTKGLLFQRGWNGRLAFYSKAQNSS